MLAKKFRLSKEKAFKKVYQKGKFFFTSNINLRFANNQAKNTRFGFVISKKISKKATVRNKIKRQLSEIIRKHLNSIVKEKDIIIKVKKPYIKKSFKEKEQILVKIFKKSKLWIK
ncbi:MAG: ribonuclease P protein component [Patescibacteria group bacterium]|nr:ribonuclease P protein component [Patescibacteria group bacterium]